MPARVNRHVAIAPCFMTLSNRRSSRAAHFWPSVRGIEHSQLRGKEDGYDKKTAYNPSSLLTAEVL
jgi:hypothetical protein